ncbi:chemotaxis protein CheA [Shewanella baltica]|uniref:Chemotaxis protein CheA n=1 Tax=Shewanella baltica (strain OS155 / ATCC BAA-1091) TaxID=325240 RepID=A3D4E8_SHEB5|nr:chemotaxis protein CheW [Shewanella baltica]ABN61611.1 CheA signal transduction histidine kinase [Shewanella baltica OS155]AEH13927.1 CheA signal transduction histidine kinase [Shewanella baltica OS117]
MSINMAEFHQVFFEESHEHLENMEQLLLALDLASPDPEELNTIFRAAHSIKGGSGIFGFTALTSVTHVMENLLDMTRKGNFQLTSSIIDLLLSTVDTLSHILSLYREEEQIDWQEVEYSKSQLVAALNGESFSSSVAVQNGTDIANTPVTPTLNAEPSALVETEDELGFGFFEDEMARDIAIEGEDFGFFEEAYQAEEISAQSVINDVSNTEKAAEPFDFTSDDELGFGFFEALTPESFANESVRMLPVSFVFNRFNRLVRDLSEQLGKNVNLVIEGGNTEIDKGMIEKLVDPLTHLVRNSLDHGIEKPDKRLAAGKSEVGVLSLKASQRGGNIVIAVHDNGAGLNRERIIQKARENGLQVADNISDKQVWQLIFAAGFSTAVEVTDVSGRGVGMDVVRRNIEALGGRIDIESTEGQGSTFEIQLPLTLAIVDGMTVSVGSQIYILPLVHIIESIQPQTEQLKFLAKERLLKVREEYLPLLNLYQLMEIEPNAKSPEEGIVVLLESNHKRFGLCVDALVGQQQVVIKSLEKHYRRIPGVSGATIMGDGSVALILDVESLALHIKN